MKRCPICQRTFTDETLRFCRHDGGTLVNTASASDYDSPTVVFSDALTRREVSAPLSQGLPPSIAVLPFVNMSVDAENEYFCDGLAEELINALTKLENLRIPARTSAFSFKGKDIDVREIGRELNVNTVLEGSVRKAGARLRITAQLINVSDGYHLWSERYDRDMDDVFAIQDEISLAIVSALKVKLFGEERKTLLKRYTEDPEAYQLYLQGRYYWNKRTAEGLTKAITCFEQAIAKDPNYARAYAGLADANNNLGSYSIVVPRQAFPPAKAAAFKALELDETLAEAHASLAFSQFMFDWDWSAAESEFKRALELNAGYATAHHWYAWYLIALGRLQEAAVEMKRAQELDSLSLPINTNLGFVCYFARQYDAAIEQFRKALDMDATFAEAHRGLAESLEQKGMLAEAITELEKARTLSGDSTEDLAHLGHTQALAGKRAEALEIIEQLISLSQRQYVSSHDVASIHTALGDKEKAFQWLERAYQERAYRLAWIKVDPKLDSLRDDPRFTDLLGRMKLLPQAWVVS